MVREGPNKESMPKSLDGTGRQLCSIPGCGRWSVPGLVHGSGKCPYHWAAGAWGEAWAKSCYPNYSPKVGGNYEGPASEDVCRGGV